MTAGRLFDVRVPMADGVTLSTDVVLPRGAGSRPAVLMPTPDSKVNDRGYSGRPPFRFGAFYAADYVEVNGPHLSRLVPRATGAVGAEGSEASP
jgi:predicted acyl esterase